jgi:23S rRNA (cytidine2498-2'-O)-methyltransferase
VFLALTEPGWEQPLQDELQQRFSPSARMLVPGALLIEEDLHPAQTPWLAWARQTLPRAEILNAPSINRWAELIGQRVIESLKEYTGPWRLLLSSLAPEARLLSPRRIELIEAAVWDYLKRRQKRLLKTVVQEPTPFSSETALLQIAWQNETVGYWSGLLPIEQQQWRRSVSHYPAGLIPIAQDKSAPARAFAKLVEAELQLGQAIHAGQQCVDLGAAPGSWTWWAIQQGAAVLAIDRSPLRDDLMQHRRVTFQQGDALAYRPEQPIDWLLCDVAAFPERIYELLEHWLLPRHCRAFVVTIKFRGQEDYQLLPRFAALLEQSGYEFLLRRMNANKNEVTALGYWTQS